MLDRMSATILFMVLLIAATTQAQSVNVGKYGAKPQPGFDNSGAINSACAALRPSSPGDYKTVTLEFEPGAYEISGAIKTYGGIVLKGNHTVLKTQKGFSDPSMIELTGVGTPSQYQMGGVVGMVFESEVPNVIAVKSRALVVTNSRFNHNRFSCANAFFLDTYTQQCEIRNNYSLGELNTFLKLTGNANFISQMNKEGGSGSAIGPYIQIGASETSKRTEPWPFASTANHLSGILIEGGFADGKYPLLIENAPLTKLENHWYEPVNQFSPYSIKVSDSPNLEISGGLILSSVTPLKMQLKNSNVRIDRYSMQWGQRLDDWFEVDDESHVFIEQLNGSLVADATRLETASRISVKRIVDDRKREKAGYSEASEPVLTGPNLVSSAGRITSQTSWRTDSTMPKRSYPESDVSSGTMLKLDFGRVWQYEQFHTSIQITESQVALPFSIAYWVNPLEGDKNGWVNPYISGCGIKESNDISRCHVGKGWQLGHVTIIPQQPGELKVGLSLVNCQVVLVDGFALRIGTQSIPDTRSE